ncbi:MAG: ABC transporter permease, partial [Actinomycetes bacterium]
MTTTALRHQAPATRSQARHCAGLAAAAAAVLVLAAGSLFVGVSDVSLPALLVGDADAVDVFWISRVPRTLAVLLAGMAVAVA